MKISVFSLFFAFLFLLPEAQAFDFAQNGRTFTVSGKRIELTVRDAAVVGVVNKENKFKLTSPENTVDMYVSGLGNMTGNVKELSRTHFPWGEPVIKQNRKRQKSPVYGKPCAQSKIEVKKGNDGVSVTWRGLDF
ncbi:MAG: hypothetical protein IJS01_02375, partial [Lentisphaeria bacterium]|nr:hypothetical protein [Lentisphaeria bacterium]